MLSSRTLLAGVSGEILAELNPYRFVLHAASSNEAPRHGVARRLVKHRMMWSFKSLLASVYFANQFEAVEAHQKR